jgi:hypothetical protein
MTHPPDLAILSPAATPRAKPLKDYYSRKEAALYLTSIGHPISVQTLCNKASNNNSGSGPPFDRTGWGSVRYARADLEAWARARTTRVE